MSISYNGDTVLSLEEMLFSMARPGITIFLHHSPFQNSWYATLECEHDGNKLRLKCVGDTALAATLALHDKWYTFTDHDTFFKPVLLSSQIEGETAPALR